MTCETERVFLQPGSEAMDGALKSGDRLILTLPGNVVVHAHVKEPSHEGSLLVTYGGQVALERGLEVWVQSQDSQPRKNYYMQVKAEPVPGRPYLLLHRNPGASLNMRRRGWRVPFTAPTAIRSEGDRHFRSATFYDLSLVSARVAAECQFPPDTRVMLRVVLPKFPEHQIAGRVIRTSKTPVSTDFYGQEMYGLVILFETMSSLASKHLTFFLWKHIREVYAQQMRLLYDMGHRKQAGD